MWIAPRLLQVRRQPSKPDARAVVAPWPLAWNLLKPPGQAPKRHPPRPLVPVAHDMQRASWTLVHNGLGPQGPAITWLASIRFLHASVCKIPPDRRPRRVLSHAGQPAVKPCVSKFLRVMYKDLGPRIGRLGSARSSAASGSSGAKLIGWGRISPVTGLQSQGIPLNSSTNFLFHRHCAGFLRILTTLWIPASSPTNFSVELQSRPT